MLFLSCIVGEEENVRRREKLVQILEKAAKYTRDAQTDRGGWGYVSAKDGSNFDEGSVTITQVQALRAARNAGIIVPAEAIKDAIKYLRASTNEQGGVMYSLAFGGGRSEGRPALTAAAVACGFNAGEYQGDVVKKWLKNCQLTLSIPLGDDRFKKMFHDAKSDELLTWSKYRKSVFEDFKKTQAADGSWSHDS